MWGHSQYGDRKLFGLALKLALATSVESVEAWTSLKADKGAVHACCVVVDFIGMIMHINLMRATMLELCMLAVLMA